MKSLFLIVCAALIGSNAWGATRSVLIPQQALVIIQGFSTQTGELDEDPYILYDAMEVVERGDEGADKTKMVEATDRSFNITCVHRTGSGVKQCQIIVRKSDNSTIDAFRGKVQYVADDQSIQPIIDAFNSEGAFEFKTFDGLLKIEVNESSVVFDYEKQ